MAFIKNSDSLVGKRVKLKRDFGSMAGKFTEGSVVTVTELAERGYSVEDEEGNEMIEMGFDIGDEV